MTVRESASTALPTLLQRAAGVAGLNADQVGLTARPSANSAAGNGTQRGIVHCRAGGVDRESCAPRWCCSVSRWVWQLPNNLGQTVASATRWMPTAPAALATCSM